MLIIDELYYPNLMLFSILSLPFFTIESGSIFLSYAIKIQIFILKESIYFRTTDSKYNIYFLNEYNFINRSYEIKYMNIFQNKIINSAIQKNVDVLKLDIYYNHNRDLSVYYEYHVVFSGDRDNIDSVIMEIKSIQPTPNVKNVLYETIFPEDSTSDFLVHAKLVIFT